MPERAWDVGPLPSEVLYLEMAIALLVPTSLMTVIRLHMESVFLRFVWNITMLFPR